jgi:hypothetical protein
MEDQRVPNLEEMDEEQAGQFLTGQGGTVGCRGGHRLRRWAGIRRGADQRAARREDVAGAVGRADGTLGSGSRISRGVRDDHGQSCVDE